MEAEDVAIGLTIFHELQHITSSVYDHETHAYAKDQMVDLAVADPVGARLNAASYQMYIADAGMTRENFSKYTIGQGGDVIDQHCAD